MLALISLGVFAVIRIRNAPERMARASRFYGSHTGGAWLILFMIFNVLWTMFLFRGAASALGLLPYESGAWASIGVGNLLSGLPHGVLEVLESVGLLLHIGVMLAFTIIIVYSKHLHIFLAPVNVSAKRLPKALGPLEPIRHEGKPIDFEDPPEDAAFGRGKVEDFTWKGMLDFSTCTECGRCQSQCPAWNTGKPLSPKLVIMDLRDHLFAKAPYLIGGQDMPEEGAIDFAATGADGHHRHGVPESGFGRVHGSGPEQAARPLVGTAEAGGVIDPDVLWSCTTCGACVEQCPVDIEHVDHIVDMRRYQVMIESEFPSELGVLFRNLENKGNPWGQNARNRLDWTKDLPFEVPVFDGELSAGDGVPVLDRLRGRVRRQGAEDRAGHRRAAAPRRRRTTSCSARRRPAPATPPGGRATSSCSRCSRRRTSRCSTPCSRAASRAHARSSPPARTASTPWAASTRSWTATTRSCTTPSCSTRWSARASWCRSPRRTASCDVTYHDPCYLGRHNEVYAEPRELVGASGVQLAGDAAARRPLVLLRRGRCAHVDGGEDRQAGQPRTRRRGPRHRSREDRDRAARSAGSCSPTGSPSARARQQGTDVEILDVVPAPARRGQARRPGAAGQGGRARRGCARGRDHSPVRHAGQRRRAASAVTADPAGDVSVGGAGTGGASPKARQPARRPARTPPCDLASERRRWRACDGARARRRGARGGWVCPWTPSRSGAGPSSG